MFYTYILESMSASGTYYRGHTTDLRQRLHEHNTGRCSHTAKHLPWKLKFYAAFETLPLAHHFERYRTWMRRQITVVTPRDAILN